MMPQAVQPSVSTLPTPKEKARLAVLNNFAEKKGVNRVVAHHLERGLFEVAVLSGAPHAMYDESAREQFLKNATLPNTGTPEYREYQANFKRL